MRMIDFVKLAVGMRPMNPAWQFTVAQPQAFEIPGHGIRHTPAWQQVDQVHGSKLWSSNPTALRTKGYYVPDVSGFHSGRYNATEAANRIWRLGNLGRTMPADYGMHSLEGALSLLNKPAPMFPTQTSQLQMARVLNSWRRNQMRQDPGLGRAFRQLRSPSNWGLLKHIGRVLR